MQDWVVDVVRPALGTALWTFVLAYAGRLLGSRFQSVEETGSGPPARPSS